MKIYVARPDLRSYKSFVFFSGKITNSFYVYLLRQGVDPAEIYELADIADGLLKDPTAWIDAAKVESFLSQIEDRFSARFSDRDLMLAVGHEASDLKAWGVLDSVLRMIERPQEVFTQPQRFISYFVSPSPPIANFSRTDAGVSFDLPISFEEYPLVCGYLCSAIESLPSFIGGQMAECTWQGNRISVQWKQEQSEFSSGDLQKRVLAPQFMESLIDTLEKTERALEEKSRELEKIKQENTSAAQSQSQDLEKWFRLYRNFNKYGQQVLRLQDYFTRSQQLITLLVGQERANPQVLTAMKKVNWDQVELNFPDVVSSLLKEFELEQKGLNARSPNVQNIETTSPGNSGQPWLSNS